MKKLSAFLFFAVSAVNANSTMTSSQLDEFKDSIRRGCIKTGLQRGDENAVSFCNCMDKILRANLSDDDFEKMARLAREAVNPADVPLLKALLQKIEACKSDTGG